MATSTAIKSVHRRSVFKKRNTVSHTAAALCV